MTNQNQTPHHPNEINRDDIFKLAAASGEEIHPDFAAMDQIASTLDLDLPADSNVVPIGAGLREMSQIQDNKERSKFDITTMPENIEVDQAPARGMVRKNLGRVATSGGILKGTRAHDMVETPKGGIKYRRQEALKSVRENGVGARSHDEYPKPLGAGLLDMTYKTIDKVIKPSSPLDSINQPITRHKRDKF